MRKKILLTILSILTVFILISSVAVKSYAALSDDKKDVQGKIDQTKNELSGISDDKDEAETELQKLTNQVTEVQRQLDTLNAQIEDLNDSISDKQKEIEDEEAEIQKKDKLLKDRMVALYEVGETSYLDLLFNSENLLDFLSNYSIIQQIVENDTNLINELEDQKQQLEEDKKSLEEDKAKVQSTKADQEVKRAELSALQEKKQSEVNKLSADEKAKQDELDAYIAKLKEIDNAIAEALRKAQEEEKKNNASKENTIQPVKEEPQHGEISISDEAPDELIARAVEKLNAELADELLSEIMEQSPAFFEWLVSHLLEKMGYGVSELELSKTNHQSRDGGIDGVIRQDKLGFDKIYIQAKRWDLNTAVGRPELQKFYGALPNGTVHGLFITTARFSDDAIEYAQSRNNIVLVDGIRLAKLMIEHNVGVSVETQYVVKRLDSDFFRDE